MDYIQGTAREQLVMFNDSLDEMISENNSIRFIDAYVENLDLVEIKIAIPALNTGKPPYNPKLFLKIYIYCYLEKIRSSRNIEKECNRNKELLWLTCGLAPDFKTIADFRKDNKTGLTNLYKDFLKLCNKLKLLSFKTTATDGTKLRAQNGKNEIYHRSNIDEVQLGIEKKIEAYLSELEKNDKKESMELNPEEIKTILSRLDKLNKRKSKVASIKELFESDSTLNRYFATDPDSGFQSDKGQVAPGYNAQICTDEKYKLIVANNITNQSNDYKQLSVMVEELKQTKKDLNIKNKTINIMDAGYDSEQEIMKNKNDDEVEIFVINKNDAIKHNEKKFKPNHKEKIPTKGFKSDKFKYDIEQDVFTCPENQVLEKTKKPPRNLPSGSIILVYKKKDCSKCKSKSKCTISKTGRSLSISIHRQEMQAYFEKMSTKENKKILRLRKELVEHPFGTIKRNWGYNYFMQRGRQKTQAEFNFICLIYNLKRVLNIVPMNKLLMAVKR